MDPQYTHSKLEKVFGLILKCLSLFPQGQMNGTATAKGDNRTVAKAVSKPVSTGKTHNLVSRLTEKLEVVCGLCQDGAR